MPLLKRLYSTRCKAPWRAILNVPTHGFTSPAARRKSLRRTGLRPLTSNLNPRPRPGNPPNAQTNRGRRQDSKKATGAFEPNASRFLFFWDHSTYFGKNYCLPCLGIKSCESLHAFGMRAFCVLPEVETEHESAISARFHKNQATNVRKYFLTTPRAGIVTCYDMPRARERGIGIGLRFGRTAQRTD